MKEEPFILPPPSGWIWIQRWYLVWFCVFWLAFSKFLVLILLPSQGEGQDISVQLFPLKQEVSQELPVLLLCCSWWWQSLNCQGGETKWVITSSYKVFLSVSQRFVLSSLDSRNLKFSYLISLMIYYFIYWLIWFYFVALTHLEVTKIHLLLPPECWH